MLKRADLFIYKSMVRPAASSWAQHWPPSVHEYPGNQRTFVNAGKKKFVNRFLLHLQQAFSAQKLTQKTKEAQHTDSTVHCVLLCHLCRFPRWKSCLKINIKTKLARISVLLSEKWYASFLPSSCSYFQLACRTEFAQQNLLLKCAVITSKVFERPCWQDLFH